MSDVPSSLATARRVTERVCNEVRNAQLMWAHFEAINGETDLIRAQLRRGVNHLGLGNILRALTLAIAQATLMALFRTTDGPGKKLDRLTLCRLSLLLESEELREDRKAAARKWPGSSYAELREKNASKCGSWMQAIRDAAVTNWTDWNDDAPPPDRRLFDLRTSLKDLRDGSLAHALELDGKLVINEIRNFLEVASELTEHAELVFLEAAPDWKRQQRQRYKEANTFWDCCERGF